MYDINDKYESVRMVQRFLKEVGTGEIAVFPSGVYDENTRLAVKDFQKKEEISESGVVDYITFDKLYNAYKKKIEAKRAKEDMSFPIKYGDSGERIEDINRVLIKLLDFYRVSHTVRESRFFTESTLDGVKSLKKIYQLDGDKIDEEFYLRMKRDEKMTRK